MANVNRQCIVCLEVFSAALNPECILCECKNIMCSGCNKYISSTKIDNLNLPIYQTKPYSYWACSWKCLYGHVCKYYTDSDRYYTAVTKEMLLVAQNKQYNILLDMSLIPELILCLPDDLVNIVREYAVLSLCEKYGEGL